MATPAHTLMVWEGVKGTAALPFEQWSFSLKAPIGTVGNDNAADLLAASLGAVYDANLKPLMDAETVLTRTRFVNVGADGKYQVRGDGSYIAGEAIYPSGAGTASFVARFPLQSAVCVSLVTTRSGPSGKGRFFLPLPSMSLGTDYRIPESTRDAIATASAEFIRDLNGEVLSNPVSVASTKGFHTQVTGVRVGRVVDTIRSRRADQIESYEVVSL